MKDQDKVRGIQDSVAQVSIFEAITALKKLKLYQEQRIELIFH